MSDGPKFNPTALSFAYLRRGELPSITPGFYRDAGLSRDEFEIARAAQIVSHPTPERFRHIEDGDGRRPKTFRHVLPDPRPSFAPPSRKLFEEDWFRQRRRQTRTAPQHIRKR